MKHIFMFVTLALMLSAMGCQKKPEVSNAASATESMPADSASMPKAQDGQRDARESVKTGQIYLYGESHAEPWIIDREIALWHTFYHDKGMRHLFIEFPYYTAEYLNQWMHEDNDDILKQLHEDWFGTFGHDESVFAFYKKIKAEYPETIFHGVDVGHQYNTTGERYLNDLLKNGYDESSDKYQRAKACMEQGRIHHEKTSDEKKSDWEYRENMMVENFIREYSLLNGEDIMGIFGAAHTDLEGMTWKSKTVPCMANQLKNHYRDSLHTEDLSLRLSDTPLSADVFHINGKEYQASFFGNQSLKGLKNYKYRSFWRLENANDDFKSYPLKENFLPYNDYPMKIETGKVYIIEYKMTDYKDKIEYHRADGLLWNNQPVTQEIQIPEDAAKNE